MVSGAQGQVSFENFATRNTESDFTVTRENQPPACTAAPQCDQVLELLKYFVSSCKNLEANGGVSEECYRPFERAIDTMRVLDSLWKSANHNSSLQALA
jgi:hypothetical protein